MIFLSLVGLGTTTDTKAEDLLTVYRQAASTSPALATARAQLQAETASGDATLAALYPNVEVGAGVSRNHASITGFGPTAIDTGYNAYNYSVTLTQPVVSGQNWVAVRASDARIRAAESELLAVEQDLIIEVSRAYFGVLRARANERVALSQRDLVRKVLEQAEAFLRVGTGDIIAVREARARVDAAESDLIVAQNALRIAKQVLIRLTHAPIGQLEDLRDISPEGPVPDRVDPWVKEAMERVPLLLKAREQVNVSLDQIEIAHRARWPRIDLGAGYGYIKGDFLPDADSRETQVGLTLALPIFTGGRISARIRETTALADASQSSLESLQDQVRFDTESSFLTLKDSVAHLVAATQAAESARISMEATRKGYEVGTRSMVDLLSGIQNNTIARRTYYIALYDHVLARLQLKKSAGVISVKDIEAINVLLDAGRPEDRASVTPKPSPGE